jgi:hypothetical protein
VVFNNRVNGLVVARVYLGGNAFIIGNGTDDFPSGTVNWAGFTPLSGAKYSAVLLAAPGANATESMLDYGTPTTTFRTGAAAGFVVPVTATLANVPADASVATIEMFAWDNHYGRFADPRDARLAWQAGLTAAGLSGTFNVNWIGGAVNTPPALTGLQSFNLLNWGYHTPPTISVPPLSQGVEIGKSATFQVVAESSLPKAYQWRFQGSNIAGAYGSSYTIPSARITDAGIYSVLVCNMGGDTFSPDATLTVLIPKPVFTNITALAGGGMRLDGWGVAGLPHVLQIADSLTPLVNWLPLSTNLSDSDGTFHFIDTEAAASMQRFYRVQVTGQ